MNRVRILLACWLALAAVLAGCGESKPPPTTKPAVSAHPDLGLRTNVPPFMKGTVWEYTELENAGVLPISSYGLVVGLRNTGDSFAPTPVREWIVKEMVRRGFGGARIPGYVDMTPERVLADPRTALVVVGGYVPPGARKGQHFDVHTFAIDGSNTSSLAHGTLYQVDLRIRGADPMDPGGSVNAFAKAQGHVFVDPMYTLNRASASQPTGRASLRRGTIPNGGVVTRDRALMLRIRRPQWAMSYAVGQRINTRFQDAVAAPQDDAYVNLLVPENYRGDWQHFVGVATHLYLDFSPDAASRYAQRLVEEAMKPDAPLEDICYCWEGLGQPVIPYISPLLSNAEPDLAFAAAQTLAYLHDRAGEDRLIEIARTSGHPFQLTAVKVLGSLPSSSTINERLATLLETGDPQVRIEAYKVLARNGDPRIWTKVINESFFLDVVMSKGPPLIYCSRVGEPRIAMFGQKLSLDLPLTFTAFDNKLSITSPLDNPRTVTIVDRGDAVRQVRPVLSGPDLAELVARLGGASDDHLNFGYGDVVAMVQGMAKQEKICDVRDPRRRSATFVLEESPESQQQMNDSPYVAGGRPVASGPTTAPTNSAQDLNHRPIPGNIGGGSQNTVAFPTATNAGRPQ